MIVSSAYLHICLSANGAFFGCLSRRGLVPALRSGAPDYPWRAEQVACFCRIAIDGVGNPHSMPIPDRTLAPPFRHAVVQSRLPVSCLAPTNPLRSSRAARRKTSCAAPRQSICPCPRRSLRNHSPPQRTKRSCRCHSTQTKHPGWFRASIQQASQWKRPPLIPAGSVRDLVSFRGASGWATGR